MEGVDKEFARTFGNYNLHGIEEAHLPDSVSWMPQTIGWKVLGVLLLLLFVAYLYRQATKWWRNRYRREALKQLAALESTEDGYTIVSRLPFLLKATALQLFTREDIASLAGDAWLEFLTDHYPGPSFTDKLGRQLITISYQHSQQWALSEQDVAELVARTRDWIKRHHIESSSQTPLNEVSSD